MAGETTTTAAKKKPAARKRAARKAPARRTAAAKLPPVSKMTVTVEELPSPGRIAREVLRAELDAVAAGVTLLKNKGGVAGAIAEAGETSGWATENRIARPKMPEVHGLTLDEISALLENRHARGQGEGHEAGYRAGREAGTAQLERARHRAVAGTLLMVTGQLEGVMHELANPNESAADRVQSVGQRLAVLVAELGRAADRYAGGDVEGTDR